LLFTEVFLVFVFKDLLFFEYLVDFVLIFPIFVEVLVVEVLVATADTFFTGFLDGVAEFVAAKLKTPTNIKAAKIPIATSLLIRFDFLFI